MHIMKKQVLLIILLALPLWLKAADVSVTGLRTEQMVDPMGLDTAVPRMSWRLESSQRNVMQTAYRILVASSPELLAQDKGDLWDSGKVESDASVWIPYQGKRLKSNQRVYWKVRSYTNRGETEWSEPARWGMGPLGEIHWGGRWIGWDAAFAWDREDSHSRLSSRYLRTEFKTQAKEIKYATLHLCGLGMYELFINGQRIGDQVLAPAPSDYRRTVLYNSFDVTKQVAGGNADNAILNMTHNKNKIVSLDGKLEQSIEGSWFIHKVGLPYSTFYVKEYAGVDPQTGKALYYMNTQDANGNYDKTVTTDASAAQAIPYKSVDPKISGGFTNIVNYKWFDLALTLTYSLGGYSFDKTGTYNETDGAKEQNYNLPIYELDRWQKPGDVTDVPRFVLGQAAGPQNSSRYVHSTDHLRVKNLTLGFTLPDQWLTKLGVSKARLYFSGSNLLTWAKWDQYDPEVPVSGEVFCETPPMRTYSFGIEVSF